MLHIESTEQVTKNSEYDKPAKGGGRDFADNLRAGVMALLSSQHLFPP